MKHTYSGPEAGAGAKMEFEGSRDVGAGKLEVLRETPLTSVELRLTMTRPFYGENDIIYTLKPDGAGTRMTWAMSGEGGFMGKLMTLLIDCDKMVAGDFEQGIKNLDELLSKP